jgi:hypothetical protein
MGLIEEIISKFDSNSSFDIGIADLLQKNRRENSRLHPERYSMRPVVSEDLMSRRYSTFEKTRIEIWMSAQYGFVLLYDDMPSAMVTFESIGSGIKISDLIGIIPIEYKRISAGDVRVYKRGIPKGLGSIRWVGFFHDYLFVLAEGYGLASLRQDTGMTAAERVAWNWRGSREDNEQVMPLTYGAAIRRYDYSAMSEGFTLVHETSGKRIIDPLLNLKLREWEKAKYSPLPFRPYSEDAVWEKSISR